MMMICHRELYCKKFHYSIQLLYYTCIQFLYRKIICLQIYRVRRSMLLLLMMMMMMIMIIITCPVTSVILPNIGFFIIQNHWSVCVCVCVVFIFVYIWCSMVKLSNHSLCKKNIEYDNGIIIKIRFDNLNPF